MFHPQIPMTIFDYIKCYHWTYYSLLFHLYPKYIPSSDIIALFCRFMSNPTQNQPVLLLYFHPFGHKTVTMPSYVQILTTLRFFTFIMQRSCTLWHLPIHIPKAYTRYQNTHYSCYDAGFTAQSGQPVAIGDAVHTKIGNHSECFNNRCMLLVFEL